MNREKIAVRFLVAGLLVTAFLWLAATVALVHWISDLI
jgi:hypothetical protein